MAGWMDEYEKAQSGKSVPRYSGIPQFVRTTSPEYKKLYEEGRIGKYDPVTDTYVLPDLEGVEIKDKDESLKKVIRDSGGEFFSGVAEVMNQPQKRMMQLLTGKEQFPSEAWGFYKPEGVWQHTNNFLMDAALDPVNILGAGMVKSSSKLINKIPAYRTTQQLIKHEAAKAARIDKIKKSISPYDKIAYDYLFGLKKGIKDIKKGRPVFETFPVTKAQKSKMVYLQNKEQQEAIDFINKYVYETQNGIKKVRPEFLDNIKMLNPQAFDEFDETQLFQQQYNLSSLATANPLNKINNILTFSHRKHPEFLSKVSKPTRNYITKYRGKIGGVNTGNTDEAVTLRNHGWYMMSPEMIGRITAHEAGHSVQKFGKINPFTHDVTNSWIDAIAKEDPDYLYDIGNTDNFLGRFYYEHMVSPKLGKMTWEASPKEISAEKFAAGYDMYKHFKKHYPEPEWDDDLIRYMHNPEENVLRDWMNVAKTDRFFKPSTPQHIREQLFRILPGVAAPLGVAPLINSKKEDTPKLQSGGTLSPEYIERLKTFENRPTNLHYHTDNKGIPTIGWGHRITATEAKKKAVKVGDEWIPFERFSGKGGKVHAEKLLQHDIDHHFQRLEKQLGKENISQFNPQVIDVLFDIVYNRGSLGQSHDYVKKGDAAGLKSYLSEVASELTGGAKKRMQWRVDSLPEELYIPKENTEYAPYPILQDNTNIPQYISEGAIESNLPQLQQGGKVEKWMDLPMYRSTQAIADETYRQPVQKDITLQSSSIPLSKVEAEQAMEQANNFNPRRNIHTNQPVISPYEEFQQQQAQKRNVSEIAEILKQQREYQRAHNEVYIDPQTGEQIIQGIGVQPTASPIDFVVGGAAALASGGPKMLLTAADMLYNPLPIDLSTGISKVLQKGVSPFGYSLDVALNIPENIVRTSLGKEKKLPKDFVQQMRLSGGRKRAERLLPAREEAWSTYLGLNKGGKYLVNTGVDSKTGYDRYKLLSGGLDPREASLLRNELEYMYGNLLSGKNNSMIAPDRAFGVMGNYQLQLSPDYRSLLYRDVWDIQPFSRRSYYPKPLREFELSSVIPKAKPFVSEGKIADMKLRYDQPEYVSVKDAVEGMFREIASVDFFDDLSDAQKNEFIKKARKEAIREVMEIRKKIGSISGYKGGNTPRFYANTAPYVKVVPFPNQLASGGMIEDDRGQWAHPGEITKINSPYITMKGVNQPLIGISDTGDTKMMFPGQDYHFKGKSVTEFPIAQDGKTIAYDEERAAELGYTRAENGHLPSRDYITGRILKSPHHDTFNLAIEEDRKLGYTPVIDIFGNVYTINPDEEIPEKGLGSPLKKSNKKLETTSKSSNFTSPSIGWMDTFTPNFEER